MPARILHAATRAAYSAAASQVEQCEAVRSAFTGNVTLRIEGAGGQHLRTMTLGPFSINTATPRGIVCGSVLADTAVAPAAPGAAGIAPTRWEFRAGSTPIFDTDEITQGPIRTLCQPRFGSVVFTANPLLPVALPPSWLASAAVNEWVSISGTALSSVAPTAPTSVAPSNPAAKITAWCGAALRRSDGTYIIGMAGGHADYAGNEINTLRLSANAPAWAEASPRSSDANLYNRSAFYADSKGAAQHTYYYSQFLDSLGLFISFCNSGVDYGASPALPPNPPGSWPYQNAAGAANGYDFRWSPAFALHDGATSGTWQSPTYVPAFPTLAGDWTAAMCVKHPWTDDVYIARSGDRWRRFNAATQTWSDLSASAEANYCGAAIDPTRSRMLIVGGPNSTFAPRVRDLNGSIVSVTFGGLGASALQGDEYYYAGVVYDEANDRFLVVRNSAPVSVYAVDASTWAVSLLATTGTAPPQRTNGIQNSVQFVPDLGGRSGIVIATEYAGNVRFLRTA